MALSDAEFDAFLRQIKMADMRCETCNNFFPKSIRLTGPHVDWDGVYSYAEAALRRAGSLGAEYVVFGSGGAKNVPEGFPLEEGFRQVVELLRKLGAIARKNGVAIVIEPLRKAECNIINTFAEGCVLAREVGMDNVRVLVDFYHLSVEMEPAATLIAGGKEYLRHVHFACSKGRFFPRSIDEDDYRPFINALKSIGYDSRLSVEAYATNFDLQAPAALKFLRTYMLG
jgi:D-psicose/D-tagatose/L-ribulose 3-epimerase